MNFKTLFTTLSVAAFLTSCTNTHELQRQHSIDDSITNNIVDRLRTDRSLSPYDIKVETLGGNVELSGAVDTHAEAAKAADMALIVSGVRSVKNDLHVRNLVSEPKPSRDSIKREVTDTALTAKVKLALLNDSSLNSANIVVSTRHGIVHLTGTATTHAEVSKAERIALRVNGVKRVENEITIG